MTAGEALFRIFRNDPEAHQTGTQYWHSMNSAVKDDWERLAGIVNRSPLQLRISMRELIDS